MKFIGDDNRSKFHKDITDVLSLLEVSNMNFRQLVYNNVTRNKRLYLGHF